MSVTRGAHSTRSGQYVSDLAPFVNCVVMTVRRTGDRSSTYYVANSALITRVFLVFLVIFT